MTIQMKRRNEDNWDNKRMFDQAKNEDSSISHSRQTGRTTRIIFKALSTRPHKQLVLIVVCTSYFAKQTMLQLADILTYTGAPIRINMCRDTVEVDGTVYRCIGKDLYDGPDFKASIKPGTEIIFDHYLG